MRHLLDGRILDWRTATVTMVAVLASWLTSWGIAAAAGLRSDVIILGTVVAVTAARVNARTRATPRAWAVRLVVTATSCSRASSASAAPWSAPASGGRSRCG